MPELPQPISKALSEPGTILLIGLGAFLLAGRAAAWVFPQSRFLQAFQPAPPAPAEAERRLRRASHRLAGARLVAAGLLLPLLTLAVTRFNPLEGLRLALAIAVPIVLLAAGAASFWIASRDR